MWAGQNSPHFCTVEKLGPTEGPNISTVFILNENMVGHNRETDGPLKIEPDTITIVLLNKEPDPITIVLLNKEPDQIII